MHPLLFLFWVLTGWDLRAPKFKQSCVLTFQHSSIWDGILGLVCIPFMKVQMYIGMNRIQHARWNWAFKRLGINVIPLPLSTDPRADSCKIITDVLKKTTVPTAFAIAPDGTRDCDAVWKTGWSTIAREMNWPVRAWGFDYRAHHIYAGEEMLIDRNNSVNDIERALKMEYSGIVPLYPKTLPDDRYRSVVDWLSISAMISTFFCMSFGYLAGFRYITIWGAGLGVVSTYYHLSKETKCAKIDLYMNIVLGLWSAFNSYMYPMCPGVIPIFHPTQLIGWMIYAYFVYKSWGRAHMPHRTPQYARYHMLSHLWIIVVCFFMIIPNPIGCIQYEWSRSLDAIL
jgi:hypothetical protein